MMEVRQIRIARSTLLREITRTCDTHGILETRFGRNAVNDPRLVHDLRLGREPGRRMQGRILAYLATVKGEG